MSLAVAVEWKDASIELPESDRTVLLFVPMAESEPVWPGYYDEEHGVWREASGLQHTEQVTHWAELPEPPQA